jgi:hypothetical protein
VAASSKDAAGDHLSDEIGEILITEHEIQDKIRELAKRITEDYIDRDLLLVGVLKGAFMLISSPSSSTSWPYLVMALRRGPPGLSAS